ncbi:MAG: protein kinase [Rhodopirellula sp.]|mgnify:CR=1 FL=1|nr:protein kinase [Rhodopirellula sp.]
MAIDTAKSLLQLIEKSKLFEPEEFSNVREIGEGASDARSFAKKLIAEKLLTRWQAGQLLAGRTAFYLGKYKLIDLIGRGGMGSVFLARHIMMNRPVALKIISKHLGQNQANLDRFFSEARAVAALNHPNIVHAYSIDNEGDRYYMAMEFVEGEDLQRMVEKKGPLDAADAADYIRQAADGLAHAHGKKIVHCDVKPANLLVNPQGVVKILDMGMARLVKNDGTNTPSDENVLGTVDYMSPELAMHSPDVDLRSDIYSLGCTLYFLLSGHPPFPEGTLAERIVRHQTDDPKPIEKIRPEVPRELIEICRKMMAKKAAERFQSCEEIAALLADWQPPVRSEAVAAGGDEEEGGEADRLSESRKKARSASASTKEPKKASQPRPPWAASFLGKFTQLDKRRKIIVAAAGGVLLLLIAGLGMWLMGSGDEPPEPQVAEAPTEKSPDVSATEARAVAAPKAVDVTVSSDEDLIGSIGADLMASASKPETAAPEPKPPVAAEKPAAKPSETAPKEKPAEKKPETPKAAEKPAEKPPAEEKPKESKPPEVKPAEKAPPAPPKKADPLANLATVVDLPLIGEQDNAKEPFELGKIQTAADVPWQVALVGGESAIKKSRQYLLEAKEADPAKASWSVKLQTSITGSAPQVEDVAKLWRDGQSLMFQWADGIAAGEANYLRNCLLQIGAEGGSRMVTLLSPLAVEPVPLDLERGSAKAGYPIKWLPEGEALKVEITGVEGPKDYRLDPAGPFAPKTPVHLVVDMEGRDDVGVKFRILFATPRSGVNADVKLVEPPTSFFSRLTATVQQVGVDVARKQIMDEQGSIQKQMGANQAGPLAAKLRQLDAQLWYVNFLNDMQAGGKLYFRVFLEVQNQQVVLAATAAPPAPKPAPTQ